MNKHPRSKHPAIDYIRELHAPEDAALKNARERMEAIDRDWQIGPEEGRLLQVLIAMHGTKSIVEVGTLAAYSTVWMARGLPECGHIHTIDRDETFCAIARETLAEAGVSGKVTQHEGDAKAMLKTLEPGAPYDMIFIDADKPAYGDYLDWAEKNIRKGGLVVVDNTLLFGTAHLDEPPEGTAPNTWKAMRKVNERLADETKYTGLLFPTEQGMTIAVKRF